MTSHDALQVQARALGDPTRHRIFRFVGDSSQPVGVAELTEHCGLNHNAVRQHLAKLVDAGLLLEATSAPSGRGRPRLVYRVDPTTDSRWGVSGPYEKLSILLTEMLRTGEPAEQVGERAGRRLRFGSPEPGSDPITELSDEMARHGFSPAVERSDERSDDRFTLTLGHCPFASAAVADQDTICRLHLGLAKGAAEAIGGIEVDRLVPHDPRRANCQLDCRLVADEAAPVADAP